MIDQIQCFDKGGDKHFKIRIKMFKLPELYIFLVVLFMTKIVHLPFSSLKCLFVIHSGHTTGKPADIQFPGLS